MAVLSGAMAFGQQTGPGGVPGVSTGNATALQSVPVSATLPTTNYCLVYNGTAWAPASCSASAPVTSVFTRTGDVVANSGDYSVGEVTGAAPLASPALTGTPTAPTASAGTNTTQVATTANVVASIPANTTAFTAAQTAPAFYSQSISAGPYSTYWNDFYSTADISGNAIGSPTAAGCSILTPNTNANHPGLLSVASGTASSNTGEACSISNTLQRSIIGNGATPLWTYETDVDVVVLPGTTAGQYQAGLVLQEAASPWVATVSFDLSSANGTPNDWYCNNAGTLTDSTIGATAATFVRLSLHNDGTYVHWYINGTEATACKTALASITSSAMLMSWSATGGTASSNLMYVDYVNWQMNVTR
jgi:hypothetical protein